MHFNNIVLLSKLWVGNALVLDGKRIIIQNPQNWNKSALWNSIHILVVIILFIYLIFHGNIIHFSNQIWEKWVTIYYHLYIVHCLILIYVSYQF